MTSDYERKKRKFLRHRRDKATPVAIVCTNRGNHKRVHLVPVIVFAEEGVVEVPEVPLLRKSGSGIVVAAEPTDPHPRVCVPRTGEHTPDALKAAAVWEFSCPLCTRTPRVNKALIAAATTAGQKVVDVSYSE
jgi:hypothetical protein